MRVGIYPGSFDPITLGHIDIIERSARIFDKLIVAVLKNSEKKSLFTVDDRIEMILDAVKEYKNVEVIHFDGLTIEFAKKYNAECIVRGLRAVTDFEYELQLAQINKQLDKKLETIFLTTNIMYSYLSSSVVKEIAMYNGDITKFVTPFVEKKLKEKYS